MFTLPIDLVDDALGDNPDRGRIYSAPSPLITDSAR